MGWEDDRAVSEVLGAMLVFGILIVALGGYQAFIVPQQNAEIEFDHNERVSEDMQDLRNAMVQATSDNEPRSTSIELRPQYPNRAFSINPGPPAGTIQTDATGEIEIDGITGFTASNVCDRDGKVVKTRSVTYKPNYNAYPNGQPITIDSSMVYRDSGSETLIDTSQVLIQGTQIRFTPVEGDLSKSGKRSISVTVIPGNSGGRVVGEDAESNFNITIPTKLSAATWKNEIDSAHLADVHDVPGDDKVKIEMYGTDEANGPNNYTFRCTPVGLDQTPTLNPPELPLTDDIGDVQGGLNPYGSFVLVNATINDNNDANVTFRHRGIAGAQNIDLTITEARFVYYGPVGQGAGGGAAQPFIPPDTAGYANVSDFEIGGSARTVDGHTWSSGQTQSIQISFDKDVGSYDVKDGDFFIVRLRLEGEGVDDIVADYFIGPRE